MKRIIPLLGLSLSLTAATAHAAVGTLSGPLTYRNLQVFLIHGDTQLEGRHYATLSEALANGDALIKETGNVQELSIENLSKKTTVFILAGDIVKGGRQDRTVRDDLILPPQSGMVPLGSFCVEHGRWTRRGQESPTAFSANSKVLSSRKLKLAARYGLDQGEVWSSVAEQQTQLSDNLSRLAGKPVEARSPDSESSLQLTLENKDLDQVKAQYLEKLKSALDGKTDVIGFVYAINGEINSAEVFNNKRLFRALWPKLLDSAVTEAIAELRGETDFQPLATAELKAFFENALSGAIKERSVWKSTRVKTYTTGSTVLFETLDLEADSNWIHKSFINKGSEKVVVPLDRQSSRFEPRGEPRFIR